MSHPVHVDGDVDKLLEQLRAVLAGVEAGEPPAEHDQVAYLRGAAAALEQLLPDASMA
jgi:hypothetical protein